MVVPDSLRYTVNGTVTGIAVMFISSELEEIIGMCGRVIVMKEGRVQVELEGDRVNEEEIMFYATGVKGGLPV